MATGSSPLLPLSGELENDPNADAGDSSLPESWDLWSGINFGFVALLCPSAELLGLPHGTDGKDRSFFVALTRCSLAGDDYITPNNVDQGDSSNRVDTSPTWKREKLRALGAEQAGPGALSSMKHVNEQFVTPNYLLFVLKAHFLQPTPMSKSSGNSLKADHLYFQASKRWRAALWVRPLRLYVCR